MIQKKTPAATEITTSAPNTAQFTDSQGQFNTQSYPTRYEPEARPVIPRKNEPEGRPGRSDTSG